jgi:outer membrane protein assembly factor BamB
LRRLLSTIALAAALPACHRARPVPPRPLFPMAPAWTAPLPAAIEGPLAADTARVYVATRDGGLRALDIATGVSRWEVDGRPGVVAAAEDTLAVRAADGTVWGMNATTGSVRWKAQSAVLGTLPPVIYKDAIVVAGEGLAALDAATGQTRWSRPEVKASAAPLVWGPWLLVGEADGALRCRDLVTGAVLWSHPTAHPLLAPPAVDERGRVLLGTTDRRFVALDARRSGSERWTWKIGADVQAPPVLLGRDVLFVTHEDVAYALRRGNGHLVWRAPLPSRPLSGPLLHGDSVLVACFGVRPGETFLIGLDGRTGRREGDLKAPGEVRTPPLIVGDLILLGLRERAVAALRLGGGAGPNP